jgi:hypothetical protein
MKSLLYLVLGAEGSGRAALVASWLEENSRVLVHVDEKGKALSAGISPEKIVPWKWMGEGSIGIGGEIPVGAELFFLANGRESPVDLVEAIQGWLHGKPIELARILTVVNCTLLASHEKLFIWYDACLHFTDVVLLACREGVTNKWVQEYKDLYAEKNYPCHFRFVKNERIDNPAEILFPEARRISLAFEQEEDRYDEEGNMVEEEYFLRDEAGRRKKWVPDIVDFLG